MVFLNMIEAVRFRMEQLDIAKPIVIRMTDASAMGTIESP